MCFQVYYPNRIVVTSGNGGACLVGDAAHIGTPCLANGINSALLDVLSLYKAFKAGIQEGKTPAEMLKDFENEHLEDSKVFCASFCFCFAPGQSCDVAY